MGKKTTETGTEYNHNTYTKMFLFKMKKIILKECTKHF